MAMPVEPPTPSVEQLAQWQALVERIRQGDHSQVVAWDESTAGAAVGTYHMFITRRVYQQLPDAPPLLAGWVAGIIAVLRVDPVEASMISAGAASVLLGGRWPLVPLEGCSPTGFSQPNRWSCWST
jgi:hypothetical protein